MIMLDTHTWVWWLDNPERLSENALNTIQEAREKKNLAISCISTWELALLVQKNRLSLSLPLQDWLQHNESMSFLSFIPVSNRIAVNSVTLDMHGDPADRIIVATAQALAARLVTKDAKIIASKLVTTVW